MEGGRTERAKGAVDRPTGLPSVPKIFLNTTTRDQICLLPDQYQQRGHGEKCGSLLSSTACASCSLPDLACDAEVLLSRPRKPCSGNNPGKCVPDNGNKKSGGSTGGQTGSCHAGSGTKLSVYCSPRVSRREFAPPCVQNENHKLGEYSWLHNADLAKFIKSELNRRESNSSVESDSSLRSASHVSTCATSEYTHFTSCDRLSLPVHDLSPSHPCPLGRLRRIYSNPEAPFLKEPPPGENQMRDSKSCSDLENQTKPMVNHTDLERKLSSEAGNLLSPPPLWQSSGMHPSNQECDISHPTGGNENCNMVGSPPPVDGWEDKVLGSRMNKGCKDGAVSRDNMIRQWLQGVDPAIVISNEYSSGGQLDYGGTPSTPPVANS